MTETKYDLVPPSAPLASARLAFDRAVLAVVDRVVSLMSRHWLALLNAGVGLFALLPIAAPVLASAGWQAPAGFIYYVYSFTCHQLPHRTWLVLGHPMAYCQRDAAIYAAAFVAGLVFAIYRSRARPLRLSWYILLVAPMAVDGSLQLIGWHESTALMRAVTGTLFGAATVWLAYPYLHRSMIELEDTDDQPQPDQ